MINLWKVTINGHSMRSGMKKFDAEKYADNLQRGMDKNGHRGGVVEIHPDLGSKQSFDALYKKLKTGNW